MIVETTNYFAKPGQEEAVREQRRLTTKIRRTLGLEPGRVFVKVEGSGPDVRWECSFASMKAYQEDRARRASSPEFEAARKHMHTLLEKFERYLSAEDSE